MKNIEVVAAISACDDRVLADQHGHGDFADGYEFPGEKAKEGERAKKRFWRNSRIARLLMESDVELKVLRNAFFRLRG